MNEPFEMTLYARLHTSYRREGYGGKDTLVNMVLEEWWNGLSEKRPTLILIEGVLEWKFGKLILHQDLIIDFCNNFYFQSFLIGSKTLKIKVVATCKNQLSTLVQNEFPKISTLRVLFFNVKMGPFLAGQTLSPPSFFQAKVGRCSESDSRWV